MGKSAGLTVTKAWIYGGLIVAGGVGVVKYLSRPLIRRGDRMLLIGDSLSVGLNAPMKALAAESGIGYGFLGETGTRIDQWAIPSSGHGKQLAAALAERPNLVVVSLGTNDEALRKYGTADVLGKQRPYVDQLLAIIAASGADVLWIGPPSNDFMSREFREYIRDKVGSRHWFDSEKLQIPRQPDNLHPTVKGYAGWSGLIWGQIT